MSVFKKLRPLFPYLKRHKGAFLIGGVFVLLTNGTRAFLPKIVKQVVNGINDGTTRAQLWHLAWELLAITAFASTCLFFTRWILIGISREIEFELRNDMFETLERQPARYYQQHRTGDIMARMTNDLNAVRMLLGPAIMYTANTIVFTIFALYFMWHISPRLTLYAFLPLPVASVMIQSFGRKIHHRFERIQAMFSDISARAQENFSGARLVRAFAQEDAEIAAFETANREYIRRSLGLVRLVGMLWPMLEFMLGLAFVVTLLAGGWQAVQHHISAGDFVAFMLYIGQLMWPMIALGWVVNLFQRGTASLARIEEMLAEKPTIDDARADAKLAGKRLDGDIEFRNLSFSYGDKPVLHDINLRIPAGASLAIVGPTGSGKTTLVNLIPRLYDPPPDELLLDGHEVATYPLETLRENIAFVQQESFLFSESLAENIRFGSPDATQREIEQAAQSAHIAEDIESFTRGYETIVGERGITLSGGQKQRTAIARALIRKPRILILDDALASVDTYTEERILAELQREMKGRTTIFISHRVSTVRNADQIAVLVKGRIVELGRHDELLALNGYYAELYQKQLLEEELAVAG